MDIYTGHEIAEKLKVRQQKVLHLIKSGRLKAEKAGWVWLVTSENLNNYLEQAKSYVKPKGLPKTWETRKRMSAAHQHLPYEEWKSFSAKHPYCWKWTDPELKIRKRVRAFFGGKCIECGRPREENGDFLAVHHVSKNTDACCTGRTFEWYFLVLCRKHHKVADAHPEVYIPKYKKLIEEQYNGKCYYTLQEFDELVEKGIFRSEDCGRKDGR